MDVTPPLKTYAEQKASKLTKYYDRIQNIEVIFDNVKGASSVEMIATIDHRERFIAHYNVGDAYACVDVCVDKLERQLTDHKEKFRNRKHSVGDNKRDMRQMTAGDTGGLVIPPGDDLAAEEKPAGENPA
jgi:putative sigma-54 modulation protein